MSTPTNQSSQSNRSSHGLDVEGLRASTVYTQDGDKIGKVGEVYLDDATGDPEWVTVRTGMFGSSESFVPLARATSADGDLRVPYTKDQVKDAPRTDADGAVTPEEEQRLYDHYGIAYTEAGSGSDEQGRQTTGQTTGQTNGTTTGTTTGQRDRDLAEGAAAGAAGGAVMGAAGTTGRHEATDEDATTAATADRSQREGDTRRDRTGEAGIQGRDTSGPTTDDAMTRSEERLQVGTQQREAGRARLRKHIVTERQTTQVPVSHEELKVEREPITDANRGAATAGAQLSEEEHEVVLHEERPVVSKTVEAVERVRLGTETVHDTEDVSADVRKEQIDLDQDAERAESTTARGDEGTARR